MKITEGTNHRDESNVFVVSHALNYKGFVSFNIKLFFVIQSSLYSRGFVLGGFGFANSLFRTENNNTSIGRFSGSERQNCTIGRGLRGVPRHVQGAEYKEEATPRHSASANKRKTKQNAKILSFFFEGGYQIFRCFPLFAGRRV
jgi:hypothetical protein